MKIHRIAALFLFLVGFQPCRLRQGASSASSASSSAASSAAVKSKTMEQLLRENEILSANDALWEKDVLIHGQKM